MALFKLAGGMKHGRAAAREVLLAFRSLLDVALEKVEPGSSTFRDEDEMDPRVRNSGNPSPHSRSNQPRESISIDE